MDKQKTKRKFLAIGFAPHDGIVSIGVSPHGLISIGAIPHGLISIGLVPMGAVAIGFVSMGLFSVAAASMGRESQIRNRRSYNRKICISFPDSSNPNMIAIPRIEAVQSELTLRWPG